MHPELVSLQPYYGIEDFMDTDDVAPLRHGWFTHQTAAITVLLCSALGKTHMKNELNKLIKLKRTQLNYSAVRLIKLTK